jgi:hypothetical protein
MEALVEIAGSIPDGVSGIFIDTILPAALHMALGLSQY